MLRVFEIVFYVVSVLIYCVHPLAVRFDGKLLLGEFFLFVRLFTDDHCHLHRAHVVQTLLQSYFLDFIFGFRDLPAQVFDGFFP